MDNQHQKITGYRDLDQKEIDLMNLIKEKGDDLGRMIEGMMLNPKLDTRWVALGKTHAQQAIMCLVRSVAQPTNF